MTRLDWRAIAPDQDFHWCDCSYCDREGDPEPIAWPVIVPMVIGGVDYVSDRFIAIRADHAPIPDDYEGTVIAPTEPAVTGFLAAPVTTESATGLRFRWETLVALQMTGWLLRLLDHPADASEHTTRAVGVVLPDGEHIGWAMSSTLESGREYREDVAS